MNQKRIQTIEEAIDAIKFGRQTHVRSTASFKNQKVKEGSWKGATCMKIKTTKKKKEGESDD